MPSRRIRCNDVLRPFALASVLLPAAVSSALAEEAGDACDAGLTLSADLVSARMAAGAPSSGPTAIALSRAHATVREFGIDSAFSTADGVLAEVLAEDGGLTRASLDGTLGRYAEALGDVSVLVASSATLPPARIDYQGRVAIVHPGTGDLALLPDTELVVVDLRLLPDAPELDAILRRALAPALQGQVPGLSRVVRVHDGPVDEELGPLNVYATGLGYRDDPPIVGSGSRDLPIVLLVGERLAPPAASLAVALRAARRAWIAGKGVPLAIAESTWRAVGHHGLAVRTSWMTEVEHQPSVITGEIAARGEAIPHEFQLDADMNVTLSLTGEVDDNLYLYLLRDDDEDGAFGDDEIVDIVARSGTTKRLNLIGPSAPSGRYMAVVVGERVLGGSAPFTLAIDVIRDRPLPDVIAADLGAHLDYAALEHRLAASEPPPLAGPAERSRPLVVSPYTFNHPATQARGDLRAGLIIAHGVSRLFFPFFPIVGDRIDERLIETLDAVDDHSGDDRIGAWHILRRFGEALSDAHQFVTTGGSLSAGYLPVLLEHPARRPVVSRSMLPEIHPGDTIVAIDGRAIEDVYEEELARTSGATEGFKLDAVGQYTCLMNGPLTLTLEDTGGAQRTITVEPQPLELLQAAALPGESARPSGPLGDIGAPELYYFNLNDVTTPTQEDALVAIAEASALGSAGMIVDMRGYPGSINQSDILGRLIGHEFFSPRFGMTGYVGPDEKYTRIDQYQNPAVADPAYDGPIVLLTGPHAVSAAENFMQMLVGAGRVSAVVGRRSAGTNGNRTMVSLPGGFGFAFTGMNLQNPDGSPFHGVGIVPDHEVPIVPEDSRDGIDRALLEAIPILRDATRG